MKALYLLIKDALNNAEMSFKEDGLENIKHIDLYKGQYLSEDYDGFDIPGVFIEYSIAWKEAGGGIQKGDATVTLHIVTDNVYDTFGNEEERGLRGLDLYQKIHEAVQNLNSEYISNLRRTTEQPETQDTSQHVHLITYSCELTDNCTSYQNRFTEEEISSIDVKNGIQRTYLT